MIDNRHWNREPVTVPCTVRYEEDHRSSAPANIVNLSTGGVMIESEQGFIANERISISLDDDNDSLLFELSATLTGSVRWSQSVKSGDRNFYHIGIAFTRELPNRILLTEQ